MNVWILGLLQDIVIYGLLLFNKTAMHIAADLVYHEEHIGSIVILVKKITKEL